MSMKQASNVVSLSGGKDSTAMLLMLLERGEPVADVVFFDTGWEFPEMYEHLEKLEAFIRAHADVEEFCRHRHVVLMDNNVLAHDHGIAQIEKMIRLNLRVDFNQGLDARLIDDLVARRLAALSWFKPLRLACDQKGQMPIVEKAVRLLRAAGAKPKEYFCYVLVTDVEDAHERVMFLRSFGVAPFAQTYRPFSNEVLPTVKQRLFCRWVNHKALFKSVSWNVYWEHERKKRNLDES